MISVFTMIKNINSEKLIKMGLEYTSYFSKQTGYISTQLLKIIEDMNNTNYQLVSIVNWKSYDAYQQSQKNIINHKIHRHHNSNEISTVCELFANEEENTDSQNQAITLVDVCNIGPEKMEDYVIMWEKAKNYMKTKSGFINVNLYKCIDTNSVYKFFNIAKWESKEKFITAFSDVDFKKIIEEYKNYFLLLICKNINSDDVNARLYGK